MAEKSTLGGDGGCFLSLHTRGVLSATVLIVCVLLNFMTTAMTAAGPPFLTDDPEPVEPGHGVFYISSQHTWSRDGRSGTAPHFELNYGPIKDIQLHAIAPLAYDRPGDTEITEYGYGVTELGVKWRFIHEDALFKGCPQIGTFPLVELPTGSERRGLGNGKTQVFLPIWIQKSWGEKDREWTAYGGGGYWYHPGAGNKDYWFTGAVLQKQISDTADLGRGVVSFNAQRNRCGRAYGFQSWRDL